MSIDKYKASKLTIPISSKVHELLSKSAKLAGRSKQEEALLRLAYSLVNQDEVVGGYWDIMK